MNVILEDRDDELQHIKASEISKKIRKKGQ